MKTTLTDEQTSAIVDVVAVTVAVVTAALEVAVRPRDASQQSLCQWPLFKVEVF